ncbi:hypothetical protein ACPW96_18610 [Micromonospora sp. DT81.3]|uniref:hypothetical protein n=1 Tax=Micromonospora sp. DT81.3 TaxID=3416523 RepID=UPI003CF8092B
MHNEAAGQLPSIHGNRSRSEEVGDDDVETSGRQIPSNRGNVTHRELELVFAFVAAPRSRVASEHQVPNVVCVDEGARVAAGREGSTACRFADGRAATQIRVRMDGFPTRVWS